MTGLPTTIARRAALLGRGLDRSVALLAGMAFVMQVGVAVMLPLLPLYAVTLGASPTVLGLLTSSFALANAGGQLAAGFIAHRLGPRRLIPLGMGVYAGANVLIATAASAVPLILWRSVSGIGAGVGLVSERIYLTQAVDRARLAFANGLLSSAGSAGTIAGPAVGGAIAAASDLRVPFLLVAVTGGLAAIGALFLPRPTRSMADAPVALSAPDGSPAPAEATDRRILVLLVIANVGLLAGFGSFITTYAPFATEVLGWNEVEIGVQFSLFGLGSILMGPWLGHLADRHGRRRIAVLSTIPIASFAMALVAAAPAPVLAVAGVAAGGGIAGFEAAWYALLGSATGGGRSSRAFGAVSAITNLGIVAGAMVAAALWEWIDIRAGVATVLVAVGVAAVGMSLLGPRGDRVEVAG